LAVTSIWRIQGYLSTVLIYIENPDKTLNPDFFKKADMTDRQAQSLSDVIEYASDPDKTNGQVEAEHPELLEQYVTGINCLPTTARDEMLAVKERFGKDGGVVAYHGYQSFAPGECDPKTAHEIGIKLASELWGDRYQVLVATHLDKAHHLHNHFVVNTVSFIDGKRYHRTAKDYFDMRVASDELCKEYGLSVVVPNKNNRTKSYAEWNAERQGLPTWTSMIRADVDEAINTSFTENQFYRKLRDKGYQLKFGKYLSVKPPAKERFVRLARQLGEDYTMENIRKRILTHTAPFVPFHKPSVSKTYRYKGSLQKGRKLKGFRALYFWYCYRLGVLPNRNTQHRKPVHPLLMEEQQRFKRIVAQQSLLARHRIDTAEQLFSYLRGIEQQRDTLINERSVLYKQKRTVAYTRDSQALTRIKEQIAEKSERIRELRKEVMLCEEIAERSAVMRDKQITVRQDESARKEKTPDEHIRRSGGTNRAIES